MRERAAGPKIESYWRAVEAGLDTYLHGANLSAKSRGGGAYDLAKCVGLDRLLAFDGTPIPISVLRPPVRWGLGVETYKLAGPGPLDAIRTLLGDWPHKENAQDHTFTIKHLAARDESEWSVLYVYPYDGPPPESGRLDGVRMDEPPPVRHLDALWTRWKLGRRLYRSITATPIDRRTWYPIRSLYPDALDVSQGGRIRIQSALWDNWMLPEWQVEEIKRQFRWGERDAKGRPLWRRIAAARLLGEHVDDTGSGAFEHLDEQLERWLARARDPHEVRVKVQREQDTEDGRVLVEIACTVEILHKYDASDVYVITADTGKGIADGKHDPDCAHVYALRAKKLVARVNDYLGGYGLGQLLALLARRYGNALVDPAVTGGYGEAVLSGLRQAGYGRIFHQQTVTKPGDQRVQLGHTETETLRNECIGALEWALGGDAVLIESKAVIQCLRDCVKDERGKIVGGPASGWHDEDLICAGRGCWHILNRQPPKPAAPSIEPRSEWLERAVMGRPVRPRGPAVIVPPMRW